MTLEQFKEQFGYKLNNQQLKAVQLVQNPTLLLAVPGSGKTTVLVTRLGYMIYCLE
ncbi:MAG: UvrD-helicase domain-containing protein [Eubacterium ventriosum]